MDATVLKMLLHQLATELDGPEGSGSGAVALEAITEIERLERQISPAEPSSS